MRKLRFYGAEKTYYAVEHGYNSRLDEMHASILLKKLAHLDNYVARRRQLAIQYQELLKDTELVLPKEESYGTHTYYIYVVRHPKRDQIIEKLKEVNVLLNISYPWPIHTMTGYAHLGYKEGDLPVTEKLAKEIFSLPMYPSLTDEQQKTFVERIKTVLANLD